MKKLLLWLSSISIAVAPVVTVVSCGMNPEDKKSYDIGFAVPEIGTLNYIKYKSSVDIASSLVESMFKAGPVKGKPLDNYLQLPSPSFNAYPKELLSFSLVGKDLSDYNFQTGTLKRNKGRGRDTRDISHPAIFQVLDDFTINTTDKYGANLNGASKWSNGEYLKASDFIDGLVAILDLNTGSQRLNDVLDLNIKNAREFVDAQLAYAKKFNVIYKNPFGYEYVKPPVGLSNEALKAWTYWKQTNGDFKLQLNNNSEERKYVAEIQKYAKTLGIFGDKYSSHPHEKLMWIKDEKDSSNKPIDTIDVFKNQKSFNIPNQHEKMYPFQLDFQAFENMTESDFIFNGLAKNSKLLMPINKNFIDTHGGIEQFGKDEAHFISEGPFKIDNVKFGSNGHIKLVKNYNYPFANEIIPRSVKLFFQSDPNVQAALFEDGYISETTINSIYTRKLFAQQQYRKLLTKIGGFGMTGFIFNLDKNTNKNKALLDPNFRKALLFSVDRREMIKISGYDASVPSYSILEPHGPLNYFTAPDRGVTLGMTMNGEKVQYTDSQSGPIMSTSTQEAKGIMQLFANPDQTDKLRNVELAKHFMNEFKKEHPNTHGVTIKFVHDSSPMMVQMALAFKSELKDIFGDFVNLDIKGYPRSIYDTFVSQGNFDMTWKNMDYLAHGSIGNSINAFFFPDGINKNEMKSTGFVSNPTGSWTFKTAFDYYEQKGTTNEVKRRLGISDVLWGKIKELSTLDEKILNTKGVTEAITAKKQQIISFFNVITDKNDVDNYDPNFDTSIEVIKLVMAANKIAMDQGIVIPIFRVDIMINVNRLPMVPYSTRGAPGYSYVYDLLRKPKNDLPGLEIKDL